MPLTKVASIHEVEDGGSLVVNGDVKILLFRVGDQIFATQYNCTHEDLPLEDAWVNKDCTIECPWHSVTFDLKTGEANSTLASRPLKTYRVELRDENIFIDRP